MFDKSNLASKVRMVMQYWNILYDPITDPFCSNGLVFFSGGGRSVLGRQGKRVSANCRLFFAIVLLD